MPATIQNTDLRFSLTFKVATLKVRFTDLLSAVYASSYGITVSNVRGIINVTGSTSGVVYQTTGWGTATPYASADINGNTGTWYVEFDLPVDADGVPIQQSFTVEYYLSWGAIAGSSVVNVSKTYAYAYTSPTVSISMTHSCATALLTVTDETSTDYLFGSIIPAISRTKTTTKPAGSGITAPSAVVTTTIVDTAQIIGGGVTPTTALWSGVWQCNISSDLSYSVETWGIYTWIIITDTVTGYSTHEVQCTDCACVITQCIDNFFDYVLGKKNTSPTAYADLEPSVIEVLMRWMQFQAAERCGDEYDEFCTDIQNIVKGTDCFCLQDLTTSPAAIYPATGVTVSGGAVAFNFILTDVTPPSDNSWNWAFQWDGLTTPSASTFLYLWQNVNNVPFFVMDIKGAAGAAGAPGADGTGASQSVLWNDMGEYGTPAGTSEEILKTYTLPSNILNANGEQVEIDAVFTLAANDRGKTVRMYFGGNELYEYFTDSLIISGDDKLKLNATVNRVSALEQYVTAKAERGNKMYSPKETEWTEDFSAPIIIKVTGQNSEAYANDIVSNQLCVRYWGLVTGTTPFISDYKYGVESLTAGVSKTVTFATPFTSTPYTLNLTAVDVNGDTQQVTIVGTPNVNGFTVQTLMDTTLSWAAFL